MWRGGDGEMGVRKWKRGELLLLPSTFTQVSGTPSPTLSLTKSNYVAEWRSPFRSVIRIGVDRFALILIQF